MIDPKSQQKLTEQIYKELKLGERIKDLLYAYVTNRLGTLPEGFDDEPFNRFNILSSLTFLTDPGIIFSVAKVASDNYLSVLSSIEDIISDVDSFVTTVSTGAGYVAGSNYVDSIQEYLGDVKDKTEELDTAITEASKSVEDGIGLPKYMIENIISKVQDIVWPALINTKYSSFYRSVDSSLTISSRLDDLEKLVDKANSTRENIATLYESYESNKQNYLLQINVLNHIQSIVKDIQNGIKKAGLDIPESFFELTKSGLADISILSSTINTSSIPDNYKRYYLAYGSCRQVLNRVGDIDISGVKESVGKVSVSSKFPYIGRAFNEGKEEIAEHFKNIREKISQTRSGLSLIIAPNTTTIKTLFSILKFYGMDKPIELLKMADVESYFNLNPITITWEGSIVDNIQQLLGITSDSSTRSWLTQLYYEAYSRNRVLSYMGQ